MTRPRTLNEVFPTPPRDRTAQDHLRTLRRTVDRDLVHGYLLYPYGVRRHRELVRSADRSQSHIYTAFCRVPSQFDVLLGPVLDHVGVDSAGRRAEPLRVSVVAGSIGAEAWTLAAVLTTALPDLDIEIECSDLHDDTIARARAGEYEAADVLRHDIPPSLVTTLFDTDGDRFVVRDELRNRVRFLTADILNDDLTALHQPADLLFAQNVFCHLDPEQTIKGLANVLRIGRRPGVVFLDGMALDLREQLSIEHDLDPIGSGVARIHHQTRRHMPAAWWSRYYGVEPYLPLRRNRVRRYATVFTR